MVDAGINTTSAYSTSLACFLAAPYMTVKAFLWRRAARLWHARRARTIKKPASPRIQVAENRLNAVIHLAASPFIYSVTRGHGQTGVAVIHRTWSGMTKAGCVASTI